MAANLARLSSYSRYTLSGTGHLVDWYEVAGGNTLSLKRAVYDACEGMVPAEKWCH